MAGRAETTPVPTSVTPDGARRPMAWFWDRSVGTKFAVVVGLILAGADPTEAVKVQAAVMYLVLGSVATTTTRPPDYCDAIDR